MTAASGVGLGDKIAGLVRERAGKVTGSEDLEGRGEAQQGKTAINPVMFIGVRFTEERSLLARVNSRGLRQLQASAYG